MPSPQLHRTRRGITLGEVLFVAILAVLGGLILWFVARRSNERASLRNCETNVRQLGTALVMYTMYNDGRMPPYTNIESAIAKEEGSTSLPTNSGQPAMLRKALDSYTDAPNWFCPFDPVKGEDKYYLGIRHAFTSYAFPRFTERDGTPVKLTSIPVDIHYGMVWDAAGDRKTCDPNLWFGGGRDWASNHPDGFVNVVLADLSLKHLSAQWPGGGYLP